MLANSGVTCSNSDDCTNQNDECQRGNEMASIMELNQTFKLPGLGFISGPDGLARASIQSEQCSAGFFLQGAHLTDWTPAGHRPVLWMSQQSLFAKGKPIRGGVPICFPWFGPHASDPEKPAHGTARITEWTLRKATASDASLRLQFETSIDGFELNYDVEFGRTLRASMSIQHPATAASSRTCELALHTYLAVSNVRQVEITGLEQARFIDKMDGASEKPATGKSIRFEEETDRVYVDTEDTCVLVDPLWNRRILVRKAGSKSTVIWNPWVDKSQRMPDFGDHEWTEMLCIETASVGPNRMELAPGESTEVCVEISVDKLMH